MEDIRSYRIEEEAKQRRNDDDRREYEAASEDEVPFHIPRD
jgi:hypothetical protein